MKKYIYLILIPLVLFFLSPFLAPELILKKPHPLEVTFPLHKDKRDIIKKYNLTYNKKYSRIFQKDRAYIKNLEIWMSKYDKTTQTNTIVEFHGNTLYQITIQFVGSNNSYKNKMKELLYRDIGTPSFQSKDSDYINVWNIEIPEKYTLKLLRTDLSDWGWIGYELVITSR